MRLSVKHGQRKFVFALNKRRKAGGNSISTEKGNARAGFLGPFFRGRPSKSDMKGAEAGPLFSELEQTQYFPGSILRGVGQGVYGEEPVSVVRKKTGCRGVKLLISIVEDVTQGNFG